MKKEEVRIGNLVNVTDNEGGEDKVIAIERDDCICYEYGAVDWSMVQGIPLSPEWLIRLGFEKKEAYGWKGNGADYQPETSKTEYLDYVIDAGDEDYFFVRYYTWSYRKEEDQEWTSETDTLIHKGSWYERAEYQIPCKKILYIHQLQNLFYCLTGEELTLKKP